MRADHAHYSRVFAYGHPFGEQTFLHIAMLADDVANGVVGVQTIILPKNHLHKKTLNEFSGRTQAHKLLCGRAATWLLSQGYGWTQLNTGYGAYGEADLRAKTLPLYVECGYTEARKVLLGLEQRCDVLVCPYGMRGTALWFYRTVPLREMRITREGTSNPASSVIPEDIG